MDTQKHGNKENLSIKKSFSLITCKLVIRKKLELTIKTFTKKSSSLYWYMYTIKLKNHWWREEVWCTLQNCRGMLKIITLVQKSSSYSTISGSHCIQNKLEVVFKVSSFVGSTVTITLTCQRYNNNSKNRTHNVKHQEWSNSTSGRSSEM